MQIEYAAHVGHRVTHDSNVGQIGLGIAGIVVATVAAVASAPATITAVVIYTAVGAIGTYGSLGMDLGKLVDNFRGRVDAGPILTGLTTVKLGPDRRDAARAFTDTTTECHTREVAQGSLVVMLGPERRPMSRRGDRLRCADGRIAEGLTSLFVGGASSEVGQQVKDGFVSGMSTTLAWMSIFGALGLREWRGAAADIASQVASATGNDAAADLLAAGGAGMPTSTGWRRAVEALDAGNDVYKGAAAGVDLATQGAK
jgi:hypothetical protein